MQSKHPSMRVRSMSSVRCVHHLLIFTICSRIQIMRTRLESLMTTASKQRCVSPRSINIPFVHSHGAFDVHSHLHFIYTASPTVVPSEQPHPPVLRYTQLQHVCAPARLLAARDSQARRRHADRAGGPKGGDERLSANPYSGG